MLQERLRLQRGLLAASDAGKHSMHFVQVSETPDTFQRPRCLH